MSCQTEQWVLARDQVLQLRASAEQRQLIDQAAAAEGTSRTDFILRSCQERARVVLLDRTLFSRTQDQSTAPGPPANCTVRVRVGDARARGQGHHRLDRPGRRLAGG